MTSKTTSLEKKWIMYDIGNSAFTLLVSTIMPIYFNFLADSAHISETNYLAFWGYATSIATIITAILGPILGTASDFKGWKKKLFMVALLIGALGCILLGFTSSWLWFLCLFVIAKSAYSLSLVFYDSMLIDITTPERMDNVSAKGYAWGYIGSCIPFIASLALVLFYEQLSLTMETAMSICFLLIALWWLLLSVPLILGYHQTYYLEKENYYVKASFLRLKNIFIELKNNPKVLFFLIAFFFYIDGVYTIIDMATAYGTALGLDTTGLLLALLLTQIVAFPAALIFGKLSSSIENTKLIKICIFAYFLIALYGITLQQQYQFWILAVGVGIFQGAIQSLSRSYYAKIIPANRSGEYFGLYDICGKGASFMGTTLVSLISQVTGMMNIGVGSLAIMFFIGFVFFKKTEKLHQ
ncbi:MFS transporter [Massilimicrobiota sp. An134]|uniref:MFS transporter n=1 Tax=Massilimicrobiota sp. An134 TaxID=1965557 RepID=UPI000B375700|nr:MFS transporter [Massilimicrobiota sp. An134]OUQ29710.1 MFS transporter [Massilimicrobiota sp. An134]